MKTVFIVILNWNQPQLTIECVESLQKLKVGKENQLKIVVVDNGSTDDSLIILQKIRNIEVMETGSNLGFAAGNNFGIKYAIDKDADYVMILNNDTIVDSNLMINLLNAIKEDPKVAIVSPKIYFAKGYEFHKEKYNKSQLGKVIWYAGGKIDWRNVYGINMGVDEIDEGQFEKIREIDFTTGACFLARSEALKEVGLFDEKYFMYMEDMDLSERIKEKGWKIVYEPKAKLWHKVAQSSGIGSNLNDYFISRNRLLFGFKYASLRTKIALLRESIKLFIFGRHFQAVGIRDYYLRRFGKGSWV
jgi:GT2 family glycosyltransferase